MKSLRLAIIADVHGNRWALDAVLADLRGRDVSTIINLGDNANGPLDPVGCVTLLRDLPAHHVRGNGDRLTGGDGPISRGSVGFARDRLDADQRRWLRDLPLHAEGEDWVACHGSPRSDEEYLLENLVNGQPVLAPANEIAARLGPTRGSLVLCGHTHLPRLVYLDDGRLVLNPGSVGLPAYADQQPVSHVMATGSPHARYALATRTPSGWCAEFLCVPYDWNAAASAARAAGFNDWVQPLLTGRVGPGAA